MARTKLDTIRLGPTTLTNGGGEQTVGSVALSTLTSGMVDGEQLYVDIVFAIFNLGAAAYGALVTATVVVRYGTGPTYSLGAVSTTEINATGAGPNYTSVNIDQSSGNLRARVDPGGDNPTVYALLNTIGP